MKNTNVLLTAVCLLLLPGLAAATVTFSSGTHTIDYTINDYVIVEGADTKVTLTTGGWTEGVRVDWGTGPFTLAGGTINGELYALGSYPVTITGGSITERISLDTSGVPLVDGDVYIYGTDFKIDGFAVDYGAHNFHGQLTGQLLNGDFFDCHIDCYGSAKDLILMPVPEPVTLGLLAAGGMLMRRKRRSNL